MDTFKTVKTVVMYGERDSTGVNQVHFRIDKDIVNKAEYDNNKPKGILHRIDAKFQTENLGFIYPVIHTDKNAMLNGAVNTQFNRHTVHLHSANAPKFISKLKPFIGIKENALAIENMALKVGGVAKTTGKAVGRSASSMLKVKAANVVYRAAQQDTGLKAVTVTTGGLAAIVRVIRSHHVRMKQYKAAQKNVKTYKLQQKQDRLQSSIGADNKKLLTKPDKYRSFRLASKSEVLAHKEFKNAKKIYKTKTVRTQKLNNATGKVTNVKTKVVDTSQKRMFKPKAKKPASTAAMLAGAGLGSLKNSALSKMSASEDTGAQMLGKGLQFSTNEISRLHKRSKTKKTSTSKLKFDKKIEKAKIRMDSAHNKLQFEKSKPKKKLKNNTTKKAQKKSLQKRRNKGIFKKQKAQKAKKTSQLAVKILKNIVTSKAKFVILGILAAVTLVVMPVSCGCSTCSGGGSGAAGSAVSLSVYSQSNVGLTEAEEKYAQAIEGFYQAEKEAIKAMDDNALANREEPNEDNDYTVDEERYSLTGISAKAAHYDIFTLFSYLSAKYRNDWSNVYNEFVTMIPRFLTITEGTPYTTTVKNTITLKDENGEPKLDEDGEVIKQEVTYNIYVHLYTITLKSELDADTYLDDYAREQLEGMYFDEGNDVDVGLKHYEYLMQGDGGHQTIGTPLPGYDGWNKNCSLYAKSARQSKKPFENCIGVNDVDGEAITAGGDGQVLSMNETSIQIEYDDFIITYYTGNLSSPYGVGSSVKYGNILFLANGNAGYYPLQMSAFEKSTQKYVNPLLVISGKKNINKILGG